MICGKSGDIIFPVKDLISQITSTEKPAAAPKPVDGAATIQVVAETDLLTTPAEPETPAAPPADPATPVTPATAADPATPAEPTDPAAPPTDPATPAEPAPRKRGRPPGSRNKTAPSFDDISQVATVDYEAMSALLFDMSTGVLANALGPEWLAKTPEERDNVSKCLAVYLKSKKVQDIPPGLMLTVVVVAYAAPRLQAPATQQKLRPAMAWGWAKIKGFFKRKPVQLAVIPTNNQPN